MIHHSFIQEHTKNFLMRIPLISLYRIATIMCIWQDRWWHFPSKWPQTYLLLFCTAIFLVSHSLHLLHFNQFKGGRWLYEWCLWTSGQRRLIYQSIIAEDKPLSPHSKEEQGQKNCHSMYCHSVVTWYCILFHVPVNLGGVQGWLRLIVQIVWCQVRGHILHSLS